MNIKKFLLGIIIGGIVIAIISFDLLAYISWDNIKQQQLALMTYYDNNPILSTIIFFTSYVAITGLSLPGATILTLLAGALLGGVSGTILVSFASSIGATCAFLLSRYLFYDYIQNKYHKKLSIINNHIEQEGIFYLFALRLTPVFPFFLINILMGITPIKIKQFFLTSQIGMLPGTMLYVFAGTQLGQLHSVNDILSPMLLLTFTVLGIFPFLTKKLVNYIKSKSYQYNIVVIGAGSAGLVSAYIASMLKAKVALIEKKSMGGDCLNTGCVPSKALIRSAKILAYANKSQEFGIKKLTAEFDFSDIMHRVKQTIEKIAPHDSIARYKSLGVDCIDGQAEIIDRHRIKVNSKIITTKNIIIATGASPLVPPILGIENIKYLTSDNIWNLKQLPKQLLILGGGPIGCELAQCFARLGTIVTIVEMAPKILMREDTDVTDLIVDLLGKENITILTNHKAKQFIGKQLICDHNGTDITIDFDEVLVALGRKANVFGFGLEKLGIRLTANNTIAADPFLRTNIPNIYVCGDVTGPMQFTHVAAHQAWHASINALFNPIKFKISYRTVPWATFLDPEIARVGINEQDAKTQSIPYETTRYDLKDLDRAITDNTAYGFIKVLTVPQQDKILGVTIVGHNASTYINEFVLAMQHGLGLNAILGTTHIYPTYGEANKFVAGIWKKNHTAPWLFKLLEKWHQF